MWRARRGRYRYVGRAGVYKNRRIYRRRRYRLPLYRPQRLRRSTGLDVYAVKTEVIVPTLDDNVIVLEPYISDFRRLADTYNLYNSYRFMSLSVRVVPWCNTTSSTVPNNLYCCAPFHRPLTMKVNEATYVQILSLPRSKSYPATRSSYRRFVPTVAAVLSETGQSTVLTGSGLTRFRPLISQSPGYDAAAVRHYCAIYKFSPPASGQPPVEYSLILRAHVRFFSPKDNDFS